MALKTIIESLDEVDESLREYYKEQTVKLPDGKTKTVLALDLEAVDSHPGIATLRNAFERQKADNAKLKADNAELKTKVEALPDGITADEITRLQAFEAEAKKNADADPEKKRAHETEIQSFKNMHQQELARANKKAETVAAEKDAIIAKKDAEIRRLLIEDGLTKALTEAGVKPEFLKASKAMLSKSVKVVEHEGEYSAVVDTELGDAPVTEFVGQWAKSDEGKHFIAAPKGSDAPGSGGINPKEPNPFSKAHWNMTLQGKVMTADPQKADRLAKAAGHKSAESATEFTAK